MVVSGGVVVAGGADDQESCCVGHPVLDVPGDNVQPIELAADFATDSRRADFLGSLFGGLGGGFHGDPTGVGEMS